ncbi:TetR/AcrR family transcriptional regulator [Streptomyces neyagawaensis]|uniref:TetR/AcrR family transcriptional regulator n=1 Tax=Streptomyces neyagawaensis TaxID=42238 RepID=UPI0006E2DC99|nr:TetR/AcrR family transcriptional regulator [Streptomyces neyagawaensis]MCL6732162.1 TetR/AcrR family transcriptional regulator [Streptomyces neyagawaensis]MDE1682343.1 TetR/AcrR family transcriptional regulator [Streptomyces neyagawaensis]
MGEARAARVADLEIRPPKQRRSREAWNRVLDAGVSILEDGGHEAFTIAAVCERAGVAPPAIYARTTSKDALFLAVYEHGMQRLRAEQQVFADDSRWADLSAAELVRGAVAETIGMFLRHERFLRAVVLTSASHPEIRHRGSRYSQELGNGFAKVVVRAADAITLPDVDTAVHSCFSTVFAASVIRVAYGPGFARPVPVEDDAFTADLAETAVRYLLSA